MVVFINEMGLHSPTPRAKVTTLTLSENTLTYNKEEQEVQVASVSAGTIAVTAADYTISGNKQTNVGTYTAMP